LIEGSFKLIHRDAVFAISRRTAVRKVAFFSLFIGGC